MLYMSAAYASALALFCPIHLMRGFLECAKLRFSRFGSEMACLEVFCMQLFLVCSSQLTYPPGTFFRGSMGSSRAQYLSRSRQLWSPSFD